LYRSPLAIVAQAILASLLRGWHDDEVNGVVMRYSLAKSSDG
jgi:hypothetical protein